MVKLLLMRRFTKMDKRVRDAIKKRNEMIAKNLQIAKENEFVLRENSLEKILYDNKNYIHQARCNKKYCEHDKNKVLEELFQNLKERC